MPNIRIPSQSTKRWSGPYLGNYYGNLWKTFNIDLDREQGKVSLSRRLAKLADTTDTNSDTIGNAEAFVITDADCEPRFWALTRGGGGTSMYKVNDTTRDPTGDWRVDLISGTPSNARDMAVFENDTTGDSGRQMLFVTTDTDIAALNDTATRAWAANWWITNKSQTGLKTGVPHPITYFPFRKIMIIGDGNRTHTFNRLSPTTATVVTASRLVLPSRLQIDHIFTTTSRAWLLCSDLNGGEGAIVEWDGFSETYNQIYSSHSSAVYSGVNYREIPIVVNNKGSILEYSNGVFIPMVRNGQQIAFPIFESLSYPLAVLKPRGMTVGIDGLIYINIRQATFPSFKQVSGIWCLNPVTGQLYNKHAIGEWGSADFGNQRTTDAGAIYSLPIPFDQSSFGDRKFLVGGGSSNPDGTTKYAIWGLEASTSTTATRGYFITQYIPANNVKEFWDTLWVRFMRFRTAANRIIVKARGVRPMVDANREPIQKTATWASTTTFTVTLAAADDALEVGDEIEVMSGDNSGMLAHITVISGAHAALQTITIDETTPLSSTATAQMRFDRWKKLGTISSTTIYEDNVNIGIDSSFIQFKIEMRGPYQEMEIEELIVNNDASTYLKK